MKKKLLLSAVAMMIATASLAQGKATRVSGQLTDLGDTLLYNLIDMNLDQPRSKGTLAVKDGKFDITVNVEHPATFAIMDLAVTKAGDAEKMKVAYCTIIPGEDVTFNGTLTDYRVGGTNIYGRMEAYTKKMMAYFENVKTAEAYDSVRTAFGKYALPTIKANPNDEAAMVLVQGLNDTDFKTALSLFTPEVRDGRMAGMWKPIVKMKEAQAKREAAAKKIVAGTEAPDFTLPDIDGKPLALSSLRGKHVIIDFWGSWCGWCIKGMPKMKEYYAKYKDKVEILGVDCNDTEDKWKAAVEKHQLPWKHVRQSQQTANVADDYGINGFPTKILISPEGKIVKVIEGESPDFYTFLDETLGK